MLDALVIGAGPAGLSLAASLGQEGLSVQGLATTDAATPWPNTYGIWVDEVAPLGLTPFLQHRWKDCVVHVNHTTLPLNREYGLLHNQKLQTHWLEQTEKHQIPWSQGKAVQIDHDSLCSLVTTNSGQQFKARLVIDASGHHPAFIQRPKPTKTIAYQTAYGIVGRFSRPPIPPQQMVLMDYRDDHLPPEERTAPPTFLYAMDLGDGVYFVEETSLAHCPAISMEVLEKRLHQRLASRQVTVTEVHHIERCLFPMNMPMPPFNQPVLGFGGAASMVHPASGYMVGALLRRGPTLAKAIAQKLNSPKSSPTQLAQASWQALWPESRLRKYYLYLFGLENLMDFDTPQLNRFFETFFSLSTPHWAGFLADALSFPELLAAMLTLFGKAPNDVRWGLMQSMWTHGDLLKQTLMPKSPL